MFNIAQAHDKVAAVVSSQVGVDDGMSFATLHSPAINRI